MEHGDAREGKWKENWRMECVATTLHTTSEHGVSSITTADAHTSAASSLLNWRPCRFKWTRPFHRKTKSGFCACAVTFQLATKDGFIPGVKWPEHTVDHPHHLSTQVSYKYCYTCTRHSTCMASYEATFTFTLKHKIVIKLPGLCRCSLKQILCSKSYVYK